MSGSERKVDGNEFLNLLRASAMLGETANEETVGASNTASRHRTASASGSPNLSELFQAPPPAVPQPSFISKYPTPPLPAVQPPPAPPPSALPHLRHEAIDDDESTHSQKTLKSSPLPPRPPVTERAVSWGRKTAELPSNHMLSPSYYQHAVPENGSFEGTTGSNSLEGSLSTRGTLKTTGTSTRKIQLSIEEIISPGPYEMEAENAILKALDQQRMLARHRKMDTGTSTIFSQVPDSSTHDFEIAEMPLPGVPNTHENDDDAGEEHDEETGNHIPSAPSTGSENTNQSQKKPLLKRSNNTRHLRKQSVEQVLVDLTEAMMAIDGGKRAHKFATNAPSRAPDASAEGFAQNAVLIDRQQQQESEHKDSARTSTGGVELPTVQEASEVNSAAYSSDGNLDDLGESDGDGAGAPDRPGERQAKRKNTTRKSIIKESTDKFKENAELWNNFFRPRRKHVTAYFKAISFYLLLPLLGVAAILFYFVGNPPTGRDAATADASASFILIFCARQIITFSMALAIQGVLIDFLALDTRAILRLLGPIITLLIVQSKGWPHILFWWSIIDFAMVAGDHTFAHHWLYWQNPIRVFNEDNPSGQIVDNEWYLRVLTITASVSVVVAVKRFLIGLYLGRQTFAHYGQQLADVMNKMVLVSQVAELAKAFDGDGIDLDVSSKKAEMIRGICFMDDGEEDSSTTKSLGTGVDLVIDPENRDPLTGSLHYTEKMKLMRLLDQWEEPVRYDSSSNEIASISAVLRFRKALTFINQRYPFSQAFGLADMRESCVESAQNVYIRLMKHSPTEVLHFERIALLAIDDNGNLDQERAKALIKVFRPDRQGFLKMIDFVRSVDSVYKEFRLLDATIQNSSQIDRAFENIFNVVFYAIVLTIVLSALGLDPFALFLSLSSFILAFAFMIGNASAKYFEGVLFILVRRPYGIGDRINVSPVDSPASLDGARPWTVQHVTLFETVVTHLPTNETASLSNGSLASCRIINWARSPQAQFHVILNMPLDTPYEKLLIFKTAIEEYIKARPREWRALNGFRVNKTFADRNYIEFYVIIQHREAWQQVGLVLDSKANLTSYCQEVAKQLGLQYQAPRLPVELRYNGQPMEASVMEPSSEGQPNRGRLDSVDVEALTREFQSVARNKHQIRVC